MGQAGQPMVEADGNGRVTLARRVLLAGRAAHDGAQVVKAQIVRAAGGASVLLRDQEACAIDQHRMRGPQHTRVAGTIGGRLTLLGVFPKLVAPFKTVAFESKLPALRCSWAA